MLTAMPDSKKGAVPHTSPAPRGRRYDSGLPGGHNADPHPNRDAGSTLRQKIEEMKRQTQTTEKIG